MEEFMSVEITRDEKDPRNPGTRRDPFEIHGAVKGRKYRFVRDRGDRVREAQEEGYVILNKSTGKGERPRGDVRMPQKDEAGDGVIRRGDTIAMFMSEEEHHRQKVQPNLDRIDRRTKGARQQFINEARRAGGRPFEE
jgi:hypothetical protein